MATRIPIINIDARNIVALCDRKIAAVPLLGGEAVAFACLLLSRDSAINCD